MKKNILAPSFVLALTIGSQAATLAFDSTANDQGDGGSSYSNGIGHLFQVSTDLFVNSLIFEGWSENNNATGTNGGLDDAGDDAVTIQLWNADTLTVLSSHTFSGASEATAISYAHGSYDGVRHEHAISSVDLVTGTNYMISAHTLTGIAYINSASTQTIGSEISFLQERFHGSTAGSLPDVNDGAPGVLKYGGPSFSYTTVPEPSSTALLGLGGLALIRLRRK